MHLFIAAALGSLQKEHLLLHDGIILQHAERAVRPGADHRAEVACHGHGDEADGDGAGFGCKK